MSWGQLIWVFFPIPVTSLFLLSIPGPKKLEKMGNDAVHKLFFTKVAVGKYHIRVFHLFFISSLILFINSALKLNGGTHGFTCHSCRYEAETYWYKKAMKFRTERNFWLSLFNLFLWFLVSRIHNLKGKIIQMRETVRNLEIEVVAARADKCDTTMKVEVSLPKSKGLKKNE